MRFVSLAKQIMEVIKTDALINVYATQQNLSTVMLAIYESLDRPDFFTILFFIFILMRQSTRMIMKTVTITAPPPPAPMPTPMAI